MPEGGRPYVSPLSQSTNPFLRIFGAGTTPQAQEAERGRLETERIRQEKLGAAQATQGRRATLINKFAELQSQGIPPSKAMVQILNDPEFVDILSDPSLDFKNTIQPFLNSMIAPQPEQFTLKPGETRMSTSLSGETTEIASQPTTQQQQFEYFAQEANLSPEDRALLARAQLEDSQSGGTSAKERAVGYLVGEGKMTRDAGARIIGGTIKSIPKYGPDGSVIGHDLIDIMDPDNPKIIAPKEDVPEKLVPGISEGPETSDPDSAIGKLSNPAEMFNSAGFVGAPADVLSRFGGNISGKVTSEDIETQRNAMRTLKFTAQNLWQNLSDRGLASEATKLDAILPSMGAFTSPISEVRKGIQLYDYVKARQDGATRILTSGVGKVGRKAINEAQEEYILTDRVLSALPERSALVAQLGRMKEGKGGALTIGEGIRRATGAERDVENTLSEQFQRGLFGEEPEPTIDGKAISILTRPEILDVIRRANKGELTLTPEMRDALMIRAREFEGQAK